MLRQDEFLIRRGKTKQVFPTCRDIGHIMQGRTVKCERASKSVGLKGQWHKIIGIRFFSWISFRPMPLSIPFRIFLKIRGDICSSRCIMPVSLTPVANGKNVQSEKFFIIFWTPFFGTRVNILRPLPFRCKNSDIVPIICHRVLDTCGKVNTSGIPWIANISVHF
jgi:hypothetical protein